MAMPDVQGANKKSRTSSPNSSLGDRDDIEDPHDDLGSNGLAAEQSRNGKWWYSTYHNVTAIVAAGVLGLPTAMAYLGWGGGVVILLLSWVVTLFTLWQLVQMHELEGMRYDTYTQLGQKAFGRKLGLWIVLPQQLIVQIGLGIVYMVTGGQALWLVYQLSRCEHFDALDVGTGKCCGKMGPTAWIVIFAAPQFLLSQLGDFNAIASVSLIAALMSFCYCTIAWVESLRRGIHNHSMAPSPAPSPQAVCQGDYHLPWKFSEHEKVNQVFGAFSALGIIAFAYAGHNVVLEIQATLPSTSKKPSKIRMWRGVVVAYIIVAICYFPVAFVGYWAYGSQLPFMGTSPKNPNGGNILYQLDSPTSRGVIVVASLMVAAHVTGSYQVYAMPVFEMIETVLIQKFKFHPIPPRSTSIMRIVSRSSYVFFTAFLACTFPFFSDLLAFFGGFALTPTTYFLPCIIWLRLKKPKPFSASSIINWLLIIIGVLLAILGTIGGLRNIISDARKYPFYQFFCHDSSTNATCKKVQFH